MACVLLRRGIWTEVLTVTLLVLNSQVTADRHTPAQDAVKDSRAVVSIRADPPQGVSSEHFMEQRKVECHFVNGTEHVRYVLRCIHNREEILRFDSDVGKFVALTELGRPEAEYWNSQKNILKYRQDQVNTYCRPNYQAVKVFSQSRNAEPEVIVYPSKMAPLGYHNLLVCSATGFYPGDIEVKWFLNGQEETAGVVSTGLISNGDWTYQILVMLEMTPKHGDVYTCQVKHSSLQRPVTLDWKAHSKSAQSKMLSGVGILLLGLIFLGVGLIVHKRSQKGNQTSQPTDTWGSLWW
ncbi:H-2 class II histocompatibility antigen, E-S beta chain-like isoform X2 [Notamacropus eugenii]|uniref:H-2 class II histocompatibility antigen, E-S beta chain-like isoform X2 n=1 Tax=Notamacropus eugenii TaxID=9315 RepID=UPI003B67DBE4